MVLRRREWSKMDLVRAALLVIVAGLQIGILISNHKSQKLFDRYERICTFKPIPQIINPCAPGDCYLKSEEPDPQNDINLFDHYESECEPDTGCKLIGYLPTTNHAGEWHHVEEKDYPSSGR